ncbi:hypothetical protein GGR51DRAFT_540378 [Nemania sp. FL0031]|nr:hypothetical protein GGR51DRAFT_540378 [Nemania sp. FL0031]
MRACVACVSGAARCLPVCMLMWDVGVRFTGARLVQEMARPSTVVPTYVGKSICMYVCTVCMYRAGYVTHPAHVETICKLSVA